MEKEKEREICDAKNEKLVAHDCSFRKTTVLVDVSRSIDINF